MGLVEVSKEEFIRVARETNQKPQRIYGDWGLVVGFSIYQGNKALCYSIFNDERAMERFNDPEVLEAFRSKTRGYHVDMNYED